MNYMQNNQDLLKVMDETLDWLCEQPEAVIRNMFSGKRVPRHVDFRCEIGGTEYTVLSHFKQDNSEAILNKVLRLLRTDNFE